MLGQEPNIKIVKTDGSGGNILHFSQLTPDGETNCCLHGGTYDLY